MTPTTQRRLTWTARAVTLLYMGIIVFLSLCPDRDVPLNQVSDKYRHATAYGVFAFLIGCSFIRLRLRSAIVAFLFAVAFGGMMELLQPLFHRDKDIYDELANTIGATVGCALLCVIIFAINAGRSRSREATSIA